MWLSVKLLKTILKNIKYQIRKLNIIRQLQKFFKEEIIKIIKIDNEDRDKDEIKFYNGIEDEIKTNEQKFETGVKNLGIQIFQ